MLKVIITGNGGRNPKRHDAVGEWNAFFGSGIERIGYGLQIQQNGLWPFRFRRDGPRMQPLGDIFGDRYRAPDPRRRRIEFILETQNCLLFSRVALLLHWSISLKSCFSASTRAGQNMR